MVANIGYANNFENVRQLAASLGLVPSQHSNGGKQTLLRITKRGDTYLSTLLNHGARAVLQSVRCKHNVALYRRMRPSFFSWQIANHKLSPGIHHRTPLSLLRLLTSHDWLLTSRKKCLCE
ncbi:transposase [Aeromonas sp. FDAARGOS 1419]|nr:transposase [Aeromonas sp. FDAARGOS 1419]